MKASDLSNKNGIIAHKTPDLIDIDGILKKISDLNYINILISYL